MQNFWDKLSRPFFALAPMADVTDPAFRRVIARHGKPDVMWTEFVSADGLYHTRERGRIPDEMNPLMLDLRFTDEERPIVAQVSSGSPDMMEYAASLVCSLGFDGLDINMGCPDRSVEKQGAGAALMKDPERAKNVIQSAKRAVNGAIPVSVKTRLGYSQDELETWLPALLEEEPDAVTLHARTRKELSKVPAHIERVLRAVELRDAMRVRTRILLNGDLVDIADARAKVVATGAEGAMLGRAIFGNPWLFRRTNDLGRQDPAHDLPYRPTYRERLSVLREHVLLFAELEGHKSFALMKKHFKSYIHGFPGAQVLRERLFDAEGPRSSVTILEQALREDPGASYGDHT